MGNTHESHEQIQIGEISILAAETEITGNFIVKDEAHIFGKIQGEVRGSPDSKIILKPGSWINGKITGGTIIIEGFAQGEVHASRHLSVKGSGKVLGVVSAASLEIVPGSLFECKVIAAKNH